MFWNLKLKWIYRSYLKAFHIGKETLSLYFRIQLNKNLPGVNKDDDDYINNLVNIVLFIEKIDTKKRLAIIRPFYKDTIFKQILAFMCYIEFIKNTALSKWAQKEGLEFKKYDRVADKLFRKAQVYERYEFSSCQLKSYFFVTAELIKIRRILLEKLTSYNLNKSNLIFTYIIEHTASITGLIFIALIITIGFYEWAYYRALQVPIKTVSLSLDILLISAINWLPSLIVYGFIAFMYFLGFMWLQNGLSIQDCIKNPTNKKVTLYIYLKYFMLFWILAFLAFINLDVYAHEYLISFRNYAILWLLFLLIIFDVNVLKTRIPIKVQYVIAFLPIYMSFLFFYGYASAHNDLNTPHKVTIILKNHQHLENARLLRNYSDGVLYSINKSIRYLKKQELLEIKFSSASKQEKNDLIK